MIYIDIKLIAFWAIIFALFSGCCALMSGKPTEDSSCWREFGGKNSEMYHFCKQQRNE
jgi:hypothetical protein